MKLTLLLLLSVTLSSASTHAWAADGVDPQAFLVAKTAEVKTLMGQVPNADRKARLQALVAQVVDYGELARRSLKHHWDKRSEAEQTEFRDLLRALIEKSYLAHIERRPDFVVRWKGARLLDDGNKAVVSTVAEAGNSAIEIEYRMLRRPDDGWIAVDLAVDGVSMVRNYRRSFYRVIRKDGWTGLIDRLRRKLEQR